MNSIVPEAFSLRPMTVLDLRQCHQLTRQFQWTHRGEDWAQAFRVSKGVVVEHEENVVGTALAFVKGDFSSIGLITIHPDFQRRGIGRKLTSAVLKIATRNVTLVATPEGRGLYESLGFKETATVTQLVSLPQDRRIKTKREHSIIREACAEDLDDIHEVYRSAAGCLDKTLLNDLLATADTVLVGMRAGLVAGFGILRPFGRGAVIGPVMADSADLAFDLVAEAARCAPETTLRLDVNGIADFAHALEPLGFRPVSRVTKMILGEPPPIHPTLRQFSLASQALL